MLAFCVALSAFAAVGWMVFLHPFGPVLPGLLVIGYGVLLLRWPHAWLFLVPALLPVIDQAKVSGAIFLTDSDTLLMATVTMGYARLAFQKNNWASFDMKVARLSVFSSVLLGLLTVSYLIAAVRGFLPYAPFEEQIGGYSNRWNSLRVAKGFLFPLALLPLLMQALREKGRGALDAFLFGSVVGLAGVSAVAIYERLAYTSLLDFASDYRITGPFWEMHVGGAALDGWLALTLPFLALAMLRTRNLALLGMVVFLGGCASYVSLVTFSRGVYGAILVILVVLLLLLVGRRTILGRIRPLPILYAAAGAALLSWVMWSIFHAGGYRVLAAFVTLLLAAHFTASAARGCRVIGILAAVSVAFVVTVMNLALFFLMDKGAYVAFGLDSAAMVLGSLLWLRSRTAAKGGLVLGIWIALAMAGSLVAWHWGERPAVENYVVGALLLGAVLAYGSLARQPVWEWSPRHGALLLGGAGMLAVGVAISGGYYMGERFSHSQGDLGTREDHWRQGASWLGGDADWALGKGLGRFPETFYWNGPLMATPGAFSISRQQPSFLTLTSARHPLSWGNLLRLEQALSEPESGPLKVRFEGRASQNVTVYFEICARHLLYAMGCRSTAVTVKGSKDWQSLETILPAGGGEGGPWYAPQRRYFALALDSSARSVDITSVQLLDGLGANLLRNGDFSEGNDYWFFSSDRDHMPWHIKSVFMNLLFDQGIFGLGGFVLLLLGVGLRVLKRSDDWPEAPYFLASLAGFVTVGLFDSLLDVPRLATMFYLTCFLLLVVYPERFVKQSMVAGFSGEAGT
jgi:hypothetical protein